VDLRGVTRQLKSPAAMRHESPVVLV
jgi:hypothetical protein